MIIILFCLCLVAIVPEPLGAHKYGFPGIEKIPEQFKDSGFLHFSLHKYKFKPTEPWSDIMENLKKEGSSGQDLYRDLSDFKIEEMLGSKTNDQAKKGIISFYMIEMKFVANDIFMGSGENWRIQTDKGSTPIRRQMNKSIRARQVILQGTGSTKSTIQLNLGPKYEKLSGASSFFSEWELQPSKAVDVVMRSPSLDVTMNPDQPGSGEMISYKIFANLVLEDEANVFPRDDKKKGIAAGFRAIAKKAESFAKSISGHLRNKIGFQYSVQDMPTSSIDTRFGSLLEKWIEQNGPDSYVINLYQGLKNAITGGSYAERLDGPYFPYYDIHDLDDDLGEVNVRDGTSLYLTNKYDRKKRTESKQMEQALNKTLLKVQKKVNDEGLKPSNLESLRKFIVDLMKKNFEEHRRSKGITEEFHQFDQQFTAYYKDKIKPAEKIKDK